MNFYILIILHVFTWRNVLISEMKVFFFFAGCLGNLLRICDLMKQHQSLNAGVEVDNVYYSVQSLHLLVNLLFVHCGERPKLK